MVSKVSLVIFILLCLPGCMGWDRPALEPEYGGLSFKNRLERWAQGLLDGLALDNSGSNGVLTTVCTAGYSFHGCSISCATDGMGNYSSASVTCITDSSTPTGFVTVSCSNDSFAQGIQGTSTLTITALTTNSVRIVLTGSGGIYILAKSGQYDPRGIWNKDLSFTLAFTKTVNQSLSHTCEAGLSSISYDNVTKPCSELTFPFPC